VEQAARIRDKQFGTPESRRYVADLGIASRVILKLSLQKMSERVRTSGNLGGGEFTAVRYFSLCRWAGSYQRFRERLSGSYSSPTVRISHYMKSHRECGT
jgi:hypothetical protein